MNFFAVDPLQPRHIAAHRFVAARILNLMIVDIRVGFLDGKLPVRHRFVVLGRLDAIAVNSRGPPDGSLLSRLLLDSLDGMDSMLCLIGGLLARVRTMKMSPGDLGSLLAAGRSDLGLLIGSHPAWIMLAVRWQWVQIFGAALRRTGSRR
ncbi:hypothetical protein ACLOJK_014801 [Asimina triloba]